MRGKKDTKILSVLCARFEALIRVSGFSDAELASFLGYSSGSAIGKIRRREMFLDTEKCVRLAELELVLGVRSNIDWLLTGQGRACLPIAGAAEKATLRADELSLAITTPELSRRVSEKSDEICAGGPTAPPSAAPAVAKLELELRAFMEATWAQCQAASRAELVGSEFFKVLQKERRAHGLPEDHWKPRTLAEMGVY